MNYHNSLTQHLLIQKIILFYKVVTCFGLIANHTIFRAILQTVVTLVTFFCILIQLRVKIAYKNAETCNYVTKINTVICFIHKCCVRMLRQLT
jgi:hypothetical protein